MDQHQQYELHIQSEARAYQTTDGVIREANRLFGAATDTWPTKLVEYMRKWSTGKALHAEMIYCGIVMYLKEMMPQPPQLNSEQPEK